MYKACLQSFFLPSALRSKMADGILHITQRRNPDKVFDILQQIGSGSRGEVYKVSIINSKAQLESSASSTDDK